MKRARASTATTTPLRSVSHSTLDPTPPVSPASPLPISPSSVKVRRPLPSPGLATGPGVAAEPQPDAAAVAELALPPPRELASTSSIRSAACGQASAHREVGFVSRTRPTSRCTGTRDLSSRLTIAWTCSIRFGGRQTIGRGRAEKFRKLAAHANQIAAMQILHVHFLRLQLDAAMKLCQWSRSDGVAARARVCRFQFQAGPVIHSNFSSSAPILLANWARDRTLDRRGFFQRPAPACEGAPARGGAGGGRILRQRALLGAAACARWVRQAGRGKSLGRASLLRRPSTPHEACRRSPWPCRSSPRAPESAASHRA